MIDCYQYYAKSSDEIRIVNVNMIKTLLTCSDENDNAQNCTIPTYNYYDMGGTSKTRKKNETDQLIKPVCLSPSCVKRSSVIRGTLYLISMSDIFFSILCRNRLRLRSINVFFFITKTEYLHITVHSPIFVVV